MQFENLALEWLDVKKKYWKESTEAHYRYELYSYILPDLGEMEAEDITEETIQNILNLSLKHSEVPKKQQSIANVSQNINVDTLLFHLTEKLLEERERSLRGNKKI